MVEFRRVLWEEGTFLSPQHLQLADRHHEGVVRERFAQLHTFPWGLSALRIDEESLVTGTLQIEQVAGVFRDGFWFDTETRDTAPPPRSFIEIFDPKAGSLGVHIALPRTGESGLRCVDPATGVQVLAPFAPDEVQLTDETRPNSSSRPVRVAQTQLRVMFDGEPLADYETLKIAELQQSAQGGYRLREDFVPPCLSIDVSPWLLSQLKTVVQQFGARAGDLGVKYRQTGGLGEAVGLIQLVTIGSHWPRLLHLFDHRSGVHPQTLFLELISLAGGLTAFREGVSPSDLPQYDHTKLADTFKGVMRHLVLGEGPQAQADVTRLTVSFDSPMWVGAIADPALFQSAEFYLAVESSQPPEELIPRFPRLAKISGSKQKVRELVMFQVPGLSTRHVQVLPNNVRLEAGRVYFELQRAGEHWDAIEAAAEVVMLFPGALQVQSVEVLCVPK
ncbi:MAG: type VI secretion system baseplate subunit TssK [Planctomycetes bacterium]|nr:type VI secretion system baseplate subunit TssK [Planctomycetota bacterium]